MTRLSQIPVSELHGVGAKRSEALKEVGVESVLDLLMYYPRRYIDRTEQRSIDELAPGDQAMVLATVEKVNGRRTKNGRSMVEAKVTDGSGVLYITFFNQPWRAKQLLSDQQAIFFGKVDTFRGRRQMANPIVDLIGNRTGRIVPVYAQSEKAGLSTWEIAGWIEEALKRAGEFADPLAEKDKNTLDLADRTWAMHNIHLPNTMAAAYAARKRLAFDELLRLQTILVLRKRAIEREERGLRHDITGALVNQFLHSLPFELTGAQQRAIQEIRNDMASSHPMHRLLQGDVGSGKTLVALAALLMAVQSGHQGALMAPTEVLAEQHYFNLRSFVAGLMVPDAATLMGTRQPSVELLTNRTTAAERKRLHAGLETGAVDLLVGTHALLTETVNFRSLGAIVIDEQHRFGVEQRAILREKGPDGAAPDVLVMTATPIPRTAAMTVYGDLDVTALDELPPGRTPIVTQWAKTDLEEAEAWARVKEEVSAGHQIYVVCPLVDESEKIQAKSATAEFERLTNEVLPELRLGLLHGQMKADEKEQVMNDFRAHRLDVLVATTVIEVGVDVPNASVMVIESAGRFGIAQLHQLRGRVGRGAAQSFCFLIEMDPSEDIEERLDAMVRTTDGFELAEVDLELRGAGSILGTRQKGRSDLKLATLKRADRTLVANAREVAMRIVDEDPRLENHGVLADDISNLVDENEAEFLFKS